MESYDYFNILIFNTYLQVYVLFDKIKFRICSQKAHEHGPV